MAVVPILTEPNNLLHEKCQEITDFNKETKKLVKNLLDTVREAKDPIGAGLAASQLGVLKRVCIARQFTYDNSNEEDSSKIDHVLINPVIKRRSKEKELGWEGCLSLPDLYAQVERSKKVTVEAFNVDGKKIHLNASDFLARVIQHEMDHLDGVLITDKNVGKIISENQFQDLLEEVSSL